MTWVLSAAAVVLALAALGGIMVVAVGRAGWRAFAVACAMAAGALLLCAVARWLS